MFRTASRVEGADIRVLPAAPAELELAAAILDEASVWLERRGLSHWPRPFPPQRLVEALEIATCYLAWEEATPVGTFSLQRIDRVFWPDRSDEPPGHALYLHRLAVRRSHPGLGRALVGLSERLALDAGARVLRLDCMAANPAIRAYYEALGFEHRGDVDPPGLGWRASLYEKPLA